MTPFPRLLLLLSVVLASCSREPNAGALPSEQGAPASAQSFQGHVFERNIVFLTSRPDSNLLVPWLLTTRTIPGGVRREVRGLLQRADSWEPFFVDEWETPATASPSRILPRGRMRLVVGEGDALEQILFDEGPRQLELILQAPLAEWHGQGGETFRVLGGTLVLSSTRVPGVILDMTRGRPVREGPAGDWAVLVSGDSLQVVLHSAEPHAPTAPASFQAWALVRDYELQWPGVTVTWSVTRAFERARRDVPVKWSALSASGDMRVDLTVRTAEIQAGSGEGPQLPVDALFEVAGTVLIGGALHPVRGFLRHYQP